MNAENSKFYFAFVGILSFSGVLAGEFVRVIVFALLMLAIWFVLQLHRGHKFKQVSGSHTIPLDIGIERGKLIMETTYDAAQHKWDVNYIGNAEIRRDIWDELSDDDKSRAYGAANSYFNALRTRIGIPVPFV